MAKFRRQRSKTERNNKQSLFKCRLCPSLFETETERSLHTVNQHRDDQNRWICNDCDYSSDLISKLSNHVEFHRRQKQEIHNCLFCRKPFKDLNELATHDAQVHIVRGRGKRVAGGDQTSESFFSFETHQRNGDLPSLKSPDDTTEVSGRVQPLEEVSSEDDISEEETVANSPVEESEDLGKKATPSFLETKEQHKRFTRSRNEGTSDSSSNRKPSGVCYYDGNKPLRKLLERSLSGKKDGNESSTEATVKPKSKTAKKDTSPLITQKTARRKWCTECGKPFENLITLHLHLREHNEQNPFKCSLCNARFPSKQKCFTHRKTHKDQDGRYNCSQCAFVSKNLAKMMRHEQTHGGPKFYKCNKCPKAYTLEKSLADHMRVHRGERPFNCDQCPKSFFASNSLLKHKRFHSGEKPFKCHYCQKAFTGQAYLAVHKRVHTGEKPFKCGQCQKSFALSESLKVHQRVHSGEKPFSCDQCQKSYFSSNSLLKHKRIHSGETPFKCDYCQRAFSSKANLTIHKRNHTGEKPFKCGQCQKSFTSSEYLKVHQRVHTGEKPFSCDQCQKSFAQLSNLRAHKRTHSGERVFKCILSECHTGSSPAANTLQFGNPSSV